VSSTPAIVGHEGLSIDVRGVTSVTGLNIPVGGGGAKGFGLGRTGLGVWPGRGRRTSFVGRKGRDFERRWLDGGRSGDGDW
jgi:hypothetical protein